MDEKMSNEEVKVKEVNGMKVLFTKLNPLAITPTRAHKSDIGYDLTVIEVYKAISDDTTLYDTGISVKPPDGYYLEIIPRSSLSKTGWMLSNSVGTIDPDYRGSLLIALTKVDHTNPCQLVVPFTKCQLVLRKAHNYEMEEVDNLDETVRGTGGFGSTDA